MKNKPRTDKMFIVRKYIVASSAAQAIRKDKTSPVDDVWVDEEWKKQHLADLPGLIGFSVESREDE